jgi:hypothetical protein
VASTVFCRPDPRARENTLAPPAVPPGTVSVEPPPVAAVKIWSNVTPSTASRVADEMLLLVSAMVIVAPDIAAVQGAVKTQCLDDALAMISDARAVQVAPEVSVTVALFAVTSDVLRTTWTVATPSRATYVGATSVMLPAPLTEPTAVPPVR